MTHQHAARRCPKDEAVKRRCFAKERVYHLPRDPDRKTSLYYICIYETCNLLISVVNVFPVDPFQRVGTKKQEKKRAKRQFA